MQFVDSADDEQLIFYVPYVDMQPREDRIHSLSRFTGSVKLKSIIVIGGDEKNSPSHVQVFINRDDIDFSNVGDLKKTMAQEFDLGYDARGDLEHQTKLTKFSNCNSVTLVRLVSQCLPAHRLRSFSTEITERRALASAGSDLRETLHL